MGRASSGDDFLSLKSLHSNKIVWIQPNVSYKQYKTAANGLMTLLIKVRTNQHLKFGSKYVL